MTVRNTVASLVRGTVSTGISAVRHPIGTAAHTVGLVKGTAELGLGLVRGSVRTSSPVAPVVPEPRREPAARADGVRVPTPDEVAVRSVGPAPGQPGEEFHTEPHAASRDSAHGSGPRDRAEIDGYLAEMEDDALDLDEPVWTSESGDDAGQPALDAGEAKAIASEAAMMRKASERDPE